MTHSIRTRLNYIFGLAILIIASMPALCFAAEETAKKPALYATGFSVLPPLIAIVLALTAFVYVYLKYSKHGYEIAVIGDSLNTARYAGMNVGHVMMRTMFLSGAIAGLMGFLVVSGADYTLNNGTSGGVGFTAIIVAWLAHLNPFAMVLIAGLLAVLTKGSNTIQTNFKIPASAADVLSAIILFFMLGCEFFINYRMIFRGSKAKVPAGPAPATPAASPDTAEKEADEHE